MRLRTGWMLAAALTAAAGCATLRQVLALKQVDFDLAGVRSARLAGVDLGRITSYRDVSVLDAGRIGAAWVRRDLPLDLVLDVRADNPADNATVATMVRLDWTLLLNGRETVSGVIDTAVTLPAGQPVVVPVPVRVELRRFFEGSAQDLIDLAASAAGVRRDPSRITLRAVPTINTPLGPITYPAPITIVSRDVGGTATPR